MLICACVVLVVTLHARVWIEIWSCRPFLVAVCVTLHARVWIEIADTTLEEVLGDGHPPREGVD